VRVAEDVRTEQRDVLGELRFGVEARAGVVEVDMATRIQASELTAAELVDRRLRGGGYGLCER
jgi:hypothetical protein